MKNILITGGAGFIGSNLANKLLEKGYNVTVLDNLSKQVHGNNPKESSQLFLSLNDKIKFIDGSVTERKDWQKALENQDLIVHYAAETGTGQSMYCIEKYVEVNIAGTAILLDILANTKHSVKKIVIASSRSIYGEGKYIDLENNFVYPASRDEKNMLVGKFDVNEQLKVVATDEESKIHPSSVYGITKQNQEQLIMTVCPTLNIASVSLRYQNVYGPGQSLSNPYTGILSIFSTQIRNRNGIQIFEDGLESRDFVHVNDVVDATILALEKEEANNQIFNVGSGKPTTVIEVATTLINAYKIDVPVAITGKFRLGDIRHNFACLKKINSHLGYVPKVPFEKGIFEFTKWVLSQEIEEDKLQSSLTEMTIKGLLK